jgi:hypothetical protein
VPYRDFEQTRADAEELADDAGAHGGRQNGDLARPIARDLLQSGLDSTGVAIETLALRLHQLGEEGPDVVHAGLILVSVRVRGGAPAKMVPC